MSNIQIGKFKAGGQEYQKLQVNRTLGQSVGDQAYLGRFYSHDGNHSIALSVHDVVSDTMTQYKVFSSNNVENGTWSDVAPTSTINRNDIAIMVRTDGPVITLKLVRTVNATGAKEYRVRCLNLRPIPEKYMKEAEEGYEDTESFSRPVPQMPHHPAPMPAPMPFPGPVPAPVPMPPAGHEFNPGDPSDIDTRWLARTLMEHVAAPAPHISHEVIARKNRPGGYPGLDINGKIHNSQIPRGTLTIVVGDKTMTYDGSNDLILNLCDKETAQSLGISIASSLDGLSAATDQDIADLFDDDPNTPVLDPTDPGYLVIGEDTVVDSGSGDNTTTTQPQNGQCCQCHNNQTQQTQPHGNCHHDHMHPHMVPPVMPHMHPHIPHIPPMPGPYFPPPPPPPMPKPQQNNSGCCCCNCNNGGNSNPNPAPEPELYSLTLNKNVADSGAVEGAGEYAADTSVVISATPGEGYVFVKWSDENTTSPRTIIMPAADTEYTAYFGYTLTVSSNDDNMGTASGSGNFLPNEVTTIEAHPSEGYHFLRWSDLDSDNKVRSVTVSDNLDIIAYFEEDIRQYTVTLTKNKDDYGEVTGAGVYNEGEDVTIIATPNSGYKFVKWSDDVEDAERTFEDIHEDINLQAEFQQLNMISVTAAIKPNASYGRVEGTGDYERGTVITLTAVANPGYRFVKWMTGDTLAYSRTYTDNPLEHTVTSSIEFRAYFEIDNSSPEYTLSLHTNDEALGTVEGAGEYPEGAEVSIAANPIGDNIFVRWNDDNTENPRTITMPGEDTWYVAYFGDASSGEVTEVEGEHPEDTKIIQAFPAEGYHFVRWNDGNQENPRIVPVVLADTFTAVFEPDVRNITVSVTVNNSEWGSVTDVEETYPLHTHIQLLATPKYGYRFVKWSDDIEDNPRTVVIEEDVSLQAYFTEQFYSLDITVNDDSMGTALFSESGPYREGTIVQVTANALAGYHFVRWDDYLEDMTRSFTMDRDISHQIIFAQNSPTLTLTVNDSTMGYVTQSGDGTYEPGSTAIISAVAYDGYEFVKWSDENTNPSRSEVMDSSKTLEAIFDILMYTVNVTVPSSNVNMVTLSGAGDYLPGSTAVISVTVLPGNKIIFQKWNDGNTDNPREITVTEDVTYQAIFNSARKLTLSSNDESKGTVSVEPESADGDGMYPYNTNVTLVAAPAERCRFVRWDGLGSSNTSIRRSLNMYQDFSIQGIFDWNYLSLNVRAYDTTGYTTVTPVETYLTPATGSNYLEGDTAILSATPADNFHRFLRWDDNNTENPREITVSADKLSYIAYFEPDQFSLNVTSNNPAWGSVTISPAPNEDTGKYDRNAQITLKAVPKSGAGTTFVEWSDNHSTNATRTLNILEDKTFQAIFARDSYTLTVLATSSGHGSAAVVYNGETYPGGGTFVGDSVVQLIAIPDEGYEFTHWSDNTNNSDNPRDYLVTETKSIFASFTGVKRTVTLTCNDASRGYTMVNNSKSTGGTFTNGTILTIKAVPSTGYVFDCWSDGVGTAERPSQAITSDITLQAIFGKASYNLTLNSSDAAKGSVSINGGEPNTTVTGTFQHGTPIRITAIAKEGYEFSKWSNNSTEADISNYSMPMANTNLTATFIAKQYTLTVNRNETSYGNVASKVASTTVNDTSTRLITYNAHVTLTANPKNNTRVFVRWDDGSTDPSKEFDMPSHDVTVGAYFGNTLTVDMKDEEGGNSQCQVSGSGRYCPGEGVTIEAIPSGDYYLYEWNDGNHSQRRTVTAGDSAETYTARFVTRPPSNLVIEGIDLDTRNLKAVLTDRTENKVITLNADQLTSYPLYYNYDYNLAIKYKAGNRSYQGMFIKDISVDGSGNNYIISKPVVMTSLTVNNTANSDGISSSTYSLMDHGYTGPAIEVGGEVSFSSNKSILLKCIDVITSFESATSENVFELYASNDGESWIKLSTSTIKVDESSLSNAYKTHQLWYSSSYQYISYYWRMSVNTSTYYRYFKVKLVSTNTEVNGTRYIRELVLTEAYWLN